MPLRSALPSRASATRQFDPSPARPRVGVIGAGRAGAVVAAALHAAGYPIVGTVAVSAASRERAARLLPGTPIRPADEVAANCDLLLLAVPDDALGPLVAGLAATGSLSRGQYVAHLSGRHGLDVLAAATARGAVPMALHPAMTLTGATSDVERLRGAAFGVTVQAEAAGLAAQLIQDIGGTHVPVAEEFRPLWHAGLAHGANHLVTLVSSAADVLRAAGATDPAAVLGPLLSAALGNALAAGDSALTGPVARGDAGTVRAHLDALDASVPSERSTYLGLARATASRLADLPEPEMLDVLADVGARPHRQVAIDLSEAL